MTKSNVSYELKRFYPTSVLVTGFDIIFFWVARMMMMGNHFLKKVPFSKVYVHALVRDEKGQKMSKSKGNILQKIRKIVMSLTIYGTEVESARRFPSSNIFYDLISGSYK